MGTKNEERAGFEDWLGIKPCGAAHDLAAKAFQAGAAWQRAQRAVPDEKPLPDLMMSSYHEAIGWNSYRKALLAAAPAHQAVRQEPVAWLIDWPDEPELGYYFSDEQNEHARSRPLYTTPPTVQGDEVQRLREVLEFYARGDHLLLADPDAWDTCSGEPMNWLHDEEGTASVEDGSLAKAALLASTGQEVVE